jgi:hypothetical protein
MKKIIYYLSILLFIAAELDFCQMEVCQRQRIPEEHKIFRALITIVEDIKAEKLNSENINRLTFQSESKINSKISSGDKEVLPPLFEDKIFSEITVTPLSAIIKADTGEVNCKMILTYEDGSSEYQLLLKFVKQFNAWTLANNEFNQRFLEFLDENYQPQQNEAIITFTVRESNKTLIPYKIYNDPDIWELNKNVTWTYFEKWLFAKNSEIDMDLYWFGTNWPDDNTVFYLDPYWYRIVYAKYNSTDIKAFDLEFYPGAEYPSEPWGITTDDWGKIYISDRRNKCLIKLSYNPASNSISFVSKMNITGLNKPTDVVYSSHTTPNNSSDDYLLIANNGGKNIIKTDLNGNIQNVITRFKTSGVYYNFLSPVRIAQVPNSTYIAVIDDRLNYLIVGTIGESNTLVCHNVIQFAYDQNPTDVGTNCFGDIFVPDEGFKGIHKFTQIGVYLCSYQTNAFNFPQRFSRVNELEYYVFDQSSTDKWSANNGIKRFIPGSDAFNLSFSQYPSECRFLYTLSDFSQVRIEIINSNNQVIKAINYNYKFSGRHEEVVPLNQIPCCGTYKFRVKHRPLFDEIYDSMNKDGNIQRYNLAHH